MMTDPIADMLTRIRNAYMAGHEKVEVPSSRMKEAIARILKSEGYIKNYEFRSDNKQGILKIYLKYSPNAQRTVTGLKRISKPGLKVYAKNDELPRVLSGLGVAIISTSQGLMTDRDARKAGLGGEVICYIW